MNIKTKKISLDNILIQADFIKTPPSGAKMNRKRLYFCKNGVAESKIIVSCFGKGLNKVYTLIDGYTSYLILKENKIKEAKVYIVKSIET